MAGHTDRPAEGDAAMDPGNSLDNIGDAFKQASAINTRAARDTEALHQAAGTLGDEATGAAELLASLVSARKDVATLEIALAHPPDAVAEGLRQLADAGVVRTAPGPDGADRYYVADPSAGDEADGEQEPGEVPGE